MFGLTLFYTTVLRFQSANSYDKAPFVRARLLLTHYPHFTEIHQGNACTAPHTCRTSAPLLFLLNSRLLFSQKSACG